MPPIPAPMDRPFPNNRPTNGKPKSPEPGCPHSRDHLLRRLAGAGTILGVQPLHDGIGDFIGLLRDLSQAVCDRQLKSGTGIVLLNQLFFSDAELQIESPMAFIDLKNRPCMFFIFRGSTDCAGRDSSNEGQCRARIVTSI